MTQRTGAAFRRVLAGCLVGLLLLAGCAPDTPETPPQSQSNPAPAGSPVPQQPYPFGEAQQQAPAGENGQIPVVRRIRTDKPYVFITIDDGAVKDPDALRLIQQSDARPVLFLNQQYVSGHEDYFKSILDNTGAVLGDHTVDHPNLRGKPYEVQRKEICEDADDFGRELGTRPALFRPPFGNYDPATLRAAAACGMRAAVLWSASVNDGQVQFQQGDRLRPGDIVLMHFRKTFAKDYTAFLDQARRDGLTPVPLTDFLAPTPPGK
ncbi:polysaccharide deacetylase family protein [Amycolatopsis nigrescens]|uniref:polysaccharide deacetylase family protein n=1 Tax=Amycolatopsis nigrescens TaxID=381445 RepID=UPI0012F84939|nr:polysaccharide deacetylase family protein [Amycolatopsis nigrescens]